ncbi:MAG: hypothetical protein ACI80V_002048 [Rhodothermales bacterium]
MVCEMRVIDVEKYGAGTTQLPTGTSIRVSFRNSLRVDGADSLENLLESGGQLSLTIKRVLPTETVPNSAGWQAISVSR